METARVGPSPFTMRDNKTKFNPVDLYRCCAFALPPRLFRVRINWAQSTSDGLLLSIAKLLAIRKLSRAVALPAHQAYFFINDFRRTLIGFRAARRSGCR